MNQHLSHLQTQTLMRIAPLACTVHSSAVPVCSISKWLRQLCVTVFLGMLLWWPLTGMAATSQTVTWAGGNSFKSYGDPAQWNPTVVPVNNPGTNFTVVVPANSSITFDLLGAYSIEALNFPSGTIRLGTNRSLTVNGLSLLAGLIEVGGPSAFFQSVSSNANLGNNARLTATNGGQVMITGRSYRWDYDLNEWNPVLLSANGAAALIDLPVLDSLRVPQRIRNRYNNDFDWAGSFLLAALNGGQINLPALTTLEGTPAGGNDWLQLDIASGGRIELPKLKQVTGRTWFDIQVTNYSLPALETAANAFFELAARSYLDLPKLQNLSGGGGGFRLATNASVLASVLTSVANATLSVSNGANLAFPVLEKIENTGVNLEVGGTINLPALTWFTDSSVHLQPEKNWSTAPLTRIDDSRFAVSGGRQLVLSDPDYLFTYEPNEWNPTIFSSDGAGTRIDFPVLASLRTPQRIRNRYNNDNDWPGQFNLVAQNGGQLNFPALIHLQGTPADGNDWLKLTLSSSGVLDLPVLQQINGRTYFDLEVPSFSLPLLAAAADTYFDLGISVQVDVPELLTLANSTLRVDFNALFEAPKLGEVQSSTLTLQVGGTISMPGLQSFQRSWVGLGSGKTWITGRLTNINVSRFEVTGGQQLALHAPSYEWDYNPSEWSPIVFLADGANSVLEAPELESLRTPRRLVNRYNNDNDYVGRFYVTAQNGGRINLPALSTLEGTMTGGNDWLEISASTAGTIELGEATVSARAFLSCSGSDSRLVARGLDLQSPAVLVLAESGRLQLHGSLTHDLTTETSMSATFAVLEIQEDVEHTMEVAGLDTGPIAPGGFQPLNFGWGQLVIGASNSPARLRLLDQVDNGHRGSSGEPEALYLFGLNGQGLRLHAGSVLILGNINVYSYQDGAMTHLNQLLPPGQNAVRFDEGILATTAGPAIMGMTPSGSLQPSVDQVEVTFDIPITQSTFTTDDVNLEGPAGAIVVTGVTPVSGNTYRLSFAVQSADGVYTVRVGPRISDFAGLLPAMDQDGDGFNSEPDDDVFVGQFTLDGRAPALATAYALQNGALLGLTFNEPVSPNFATNTTNYAVNGAPPTNADLRTNGLQVVLKASPLAGVQFDLDVQNLADVLGNATNVSHAGVILTQQSMDLGTPGSNPRELGSAVPFSPADFEVVAGGSDLGGGSDAGHLVYENRSGDFDVRVRVARLDQTSSTAKAGLMWRETTAANSRHVCALVEPPGGANVYLATVRSSPGAATVEWGARLPVQIGLSLPDAWIRLQREGNVFTASRSTNGNDWQVYAQLTNNFPGAGLVGLVASSANNNPGQATTVWFRDYGDYRPAILAQPRSQTVASGATVTFAVTARGLTPLGYQWFHNGSPLQGATASSLVLSNVTISQVGDYTVVVSNPVGTLTSLPATLVVDGTGAGGFEADVAPRPNGNNAVSVSDWVQVGRFVAGLDEVLNSSEFTRADCAPRLDGTNLALGDGRLSVADWTQAGRYAAGLDPLTEARGPASPAKAGSMVVAPPPQAEAGDEVRTVSVAEARAWLGWEVVLPVRLLAQGDENAVGFSLRFDPAQLRYLGARLGEGAANASLQINTQAVHRGIVGLALALPSGHCFAAGGLELVRLRFISIGTAETMVISFADSPVWREVVSDRAVPQRATYRDGLCQVVRPARLARLQRLAEGTVELLMTADTGDRCVIEATDDLIHWAPISTSMGTGGVIPILDPDAAQHPQRFYRVLPQP